MKIRLQDSSALLRWGVSLFSLFCVFFLSATVTFGQTDTGQISGTITDATGAVVVGAKVIIKSVNTGLTHTATTNSAGLYTVVSLNPDTYMVTVEATGFQTFTERREVAVGSRVEVSLQLTVGKAIETVEVVGGSEANTVNTTSQTLSEVITSDQINELPTSPTRNPYALVGTSGNVSQDSNAPGRGVGYAINGQRSSSTNILLDGAENVDAFTTKIGQVVPLDSVQEFSVLTNNYTAEFGRASGGVVNLVTKSGTNTFHGSAYEYNRVSHLSSNTEFNNANDITKPVFTRNNFGFAVGGPVIKNKLFFFNNTEWIRVRSGSATSYTIIDPASIANLAPASQAYFAAYGKLASNVIVTTPSFPCSASVAKLNCETVSFNVPGDSGGGNPQNTWLEVARVDYNITDKTIFYARYAADHELDFDGVVNSSPYVGYNTGQKIFDQNYDFSLKHYFTPNLVNTAKATYNRINGPVQGLSTAPVAPTLYIDGQVSSVNNVSLVFPGYSETTPGNGIPFGGPQNLYQFHDDISWTHGRHQFVFGGQFIQIRDNRVFGAYENPVEVLSTNLNDGLNNLISGNIRQFQGAVYPQGKFPCIKNAAGVPQVTPACTLNLPVGPPAFNRNYRYNDGAVYAQDSWRIVPHFTLNAGLRWEYYGVQHNANENLDSNFVLGTGATYFDQIRNGSVQLAKNGGVFWKPKYTNFGPRIGFAWDVFGDGKTSLRGGYSIGYERNFGNVTFNAIQNPPNYAVVSLISAAANFGNGGDVASMPIYTDTAGPLAGTGTKALPAVSQRAINQHISTAYAESYDLSIDRSVGKGVVSVTYAGSHGVHLYDIANVNPTGGGGVFLGDARASNRVNYQYSNMNYRSDGGYSHYNALNVRYGITNFMNKGLGLTANYTFSHSLDNLSSTFTETYGGSSGVYQLGYLDGFNPKLNFGNSDFDIRHRFNLSATWQLPWLKTANHAFVRQALGGWGLGMVFTTRSGSPFTLYDCAHSTDTGCPFWAPGQAVPTTGSASAVGGDNFNYITLPTYADTTCNTAKPPVCSGSSIVGTSRDKSIDALGTPKCTGLFHVGCTYTVNGVGYPDRNQFFGPGYWNIDMNFYKSFKLTERFSLQFRGELYNIFNHSNQYIQGLNLDVHSISGASPFVTSEKGGIYGQPGQPTDERRNIQFGLRLMF